MIKNKNRGKIGTIGKIGIFSASLLTAASAVYLYSPVKGSHAESSASEDVQVRLNVSPAIAIRTDTNNLQLNANVGDFVSGTVNVDVGTNSQYGYTLTLEDADLNTNMTATSAGVSDVVESNFSGAKTSSTMADNNWGYSLDSTNFYKIPAYDAAVTINSSNGPVTSNTGYETTPVDFGVKVGMNLTSGSYIDVVRFTAFVNGQDGNPMPTMQAFNKSSLVNTGDSVTLVDKRDGNTYKVTKLADGNVWMTENLRLGGDNPIILSPLDSDVASNFELPAADGSTFSYEPEDYGVLVNDGTGFYSYNAATVGEGAAMTSGITSHSICPKGWRLPTGGSSGEIATLYSYYDSVDKMQGVPGFTLSGFVNNGAVLAEGTSGTYWSSTVYASYGSYTLDIRTTVNATATINKYYGAAIRCIAR